MKIFRLWALIITARDQDWEKHVAEAAIARTWGGSLSSPLDKIPEEHGLRSTKTTNEQAMIGLVMSQ